jgi:cytochrome c oxidase subunit 2
MEAPPEEGASPEEGAARILHMRVTGGNYGWRIRYAGEDGRLDTADDVMGRRHLHFPPETKVTIDLRSEDFAYSFHLPDFDVIEVAVPGSPYVLDLVTDLPGASLLMGNQMCGFAHPELIGSVTVHEEGEFEKWLATDIRPL